MRKATRPFLVEIRRGDRHVPKTATKPNNGAASRTPQPSHFPQNVMCHADQTFDGSHSATSTGLGEPRRKAEFEEPKWDGATGGQTAPSINKLIPQALQCEQPRRSKALTSELPAGQRWKRRLPKACW